MTLTTEQITSQTFPQARKGYDPAAVDRFLARVAKEAAAGGTGSMADIGREREDIIAEAKLEAEEMLRDAEQEVAAARHEHQLLVAELTQAREDLRRVDDERGEPVDVDEETEQILAGARRQADDLVTEAQAEAEVARETARDEAAAAIAAAQEAADALLASARAEAEGLREEAAGELEQAKTGRWEDVGDRVSRILTRAEAEAEGLLAEANGQADDVLAAAKSDASRTAEAADAYAAKVRAQAEEWSQARLSAARDDRAKAAEVLEAARSEAQRTIADAEARATDHLAEADEKTRLHVADLLAGARYDLDNLRTEEAKAADGLQALTTMAQKVLDDRARTAPVELGRTEMFAPPPGGRPGRGRGGRRAHGQGVRGRLSPGPSCPTIHGTADAAPARPRGPARRRAVGHVSRAGRAGPSCRACRAGCGRAWRPGGPGAGT
ncbi:DivIVA domain-containing protein [Aquihabitans sp. G128]|uniref:DivIVA domain-containing protein n=1 Tax=Aquihabitans sp. G128 TaxID=2849779 RepID=UPI001C227037|nr:DivIVA domain-containing protein [Aquihabitans sp. G128]QXC62129.1 DivIVA domain-containing protein [Aquihabitans sp. G128]